MSWGGTRTKYIKIILGVTSTSQIDCEIHLTRRPSINCLLLLVFVRGNLVHNLGETTLLYSLLASVLNREQHLMDDMCCSGRRSLPQE